METLDFSLLVRNDLQRVVSVEPMDNGTALVYRRLADGSLENITVPFKPWILLATPELASALTEVEELIALHGNGYFRIRAVFPDIKSYEKGLKELKEFTGKTPSAMFAPYRVFSDLTQQFLTITPARLFGGMNFNELRRMQLDIETKSEGEKHFSDPKRPGDSIILVSLKDNTGWETCISAAGSDEKTLLKTLISVIREHDPDVIEGHNIFKFDLPYIETRCKLHKIKFAIGRDGSVPKTRSSKFSVGERRLPYERYDIFGRHVVDTFFLVLLYDISHRDMDGHGLKAAAKYFGVAAPNRTYVSGEEITNLFEADPQRLIDYCMDDARETDALSRILSPSFFYQACLAPFSYQNCITRGTSARIDAMLCAEYIFENESLPVPQPQAQLQGALTEGERMGVFNKVWHVDVRSLYPSIIISRQLTPLSDTHGTFLRLLTELRKFRLAAKDARKNASPEMKEHYDALQGTFKILINSFYGYAGYGQGTFNDYGLASTVTATGREILSSMRDFLESIGALVIEMDTDGIYFTPPEGEDDMGAMERRIQQILPAGIEVEMDASYKAMFGYKSKNYALLHWDGKVTMTGAALRSRGLEPFQRRYILEYITCLLTGRKDDIPALYEKYVEDIENRRLPISDFAKREILSTSPEIYAKKLADGTGKHSAAYDLVLASGKEFSQGDSVDFYVIGNKKTVPVTGNSKLLENADSSNRDENIPYYLSKLQLLHKKFQEE